MKPSRKHKSKMFATLINGNFDPAFGIAELESQSQLPTADSNTLVELLQSPSFQIAAGASINVHQ